MTLQTLNTAADVHRAAALCLECAVDRYRYIGSAHMQDDCATACTAAATALLAESGDPVATSAVLMRCADACDAMAAAGFEIEQYAECARGCWHLAGELTARAS